VTEGRSYRKVTGFRSQDEDTCLNKTPQTRALTSDNRLTTNARLATFSPATRPTHRCIGQFLDHDLDGPKNKPLTCIVHGLYRCATQGCMAPQTKEKRIAKRSAPRPLCICHAITLHYDSLVLVSEIQQREPCWINRVSMVLARVHLKAFDPISITKVRHELGKYNLIPAHSRGAHLDNTNLNERIHSFKIFYPRSVHRITLRSFGCLSIF